MEKINKDTVMGTIYETKEYEKFSLIGGNRDISQINYFRLSESMSKKQLKIPILVNEKFQIIDGQHRFKVCQELELPVYYYIIEGYKLEEVKLANVISANWRKDDFLNMFLFEEKPAYEHIEILKSEYGVSTSSIIKLFARFQKKSKSLANKEFEEGIFSIEGQEEVTNFLEALMDFKVHVKHYSSEAFMFSFLNLYSYEEYNHENMKKKLETVEITFGGKIKTREDYLLYLCDTYNKRLSNKNKIFYDPNRKMFYQD